MDSEQENPFSLTDDICRDLEGLLDTNEGECRKLCEDLGCSHEKRTFAFDEAGGEMNLLQDRRQRAEREKHGDQVSIYDS